MTNDRMTIEQRKEKFAQPFKMSCSICGGAVHTLTEGCTSKFCPSNAWELKLN